MNIISLKPQALRLFILLMAGFIPAQLFAQNVHTRVSADSLTIGESFHLSILLQREREYQKIEFPDTNSFPSSIELIGRQQFKVTEYSDSLVYNLQFFTNEDVQVPPLPVRLLSEDDSVTIYTNPVNLYFKSIVAEGDTTLKPMKPNYAFPRPWWPWILAGLLLVGFLLWWFKYREEPKEKETEPKKEIPPFYNPLNELEKTLSAIKKDSNIAETKDFKGFYSQIGDAIRKYFEDLYQIPALESTSTELLRYLDAYGVDDVLNEKSRVILRRADLVKFAKFTPTLDDAWNTYEKASEFLERAKLVDSARISRLRVKYNQQYASDSPQLQKEKEVK